MREDSRVTSGQVQAMERRKKRARACNADGCQPSPKALAGPPAALAEAEMSNAEVLLDCLRTSAFIIQRRALPRTRVSAFRGPPADAAAVCAAAAGRGWPRDTRTTR